jgi:FkbM family methyltransferase
MNYGFFWTEKSQARNKLSYKYEPLQPLLLLDFAELLGVTQFFDVGANIGLYALLLTRLPALKKVYAFEASSETFKELGYNVELNSMAEKIQTLDMAVSSSSGEVQFLVESALSGINSVANTSFHDRRLFQKTVSVKSCALDDFSSLSGQTLALKIDVEGHEEQVVRGCERLLRSNVCILQVEIYVDKMGTTVDLLSSYGYRKIFSVKNDVYFTNSRVFDDRAVVVAALERVANRFVDSNKGKWPAQSTGSALTVSAVLTGDILMASCRPNRTVFRGELEFAFYVMKDNERIHMFWYSAEPQIRFEIPKGSLDGIISVRAFVREKSNPEKKVMVVERARVK